MKEKLIKNIFDSAQAQGLEELEIHLVSKEVLDINVFEGEVEKYATSQEDNLSVRGIYQGRMGYSYTEKLEEASIDELLNNLKGYAQANTRPGLEKISQPLEIKTSEQKENKLLNTSEEDKIDFLLQLNKEAYEKDGRIKTVSGSSYRQIKETIEIRNTRGLNLKDSSSLALVNLGLVAEEDGSMETGYSYRIVHSLDEDLKASLIEEASKEALSMLGAGPTSPARMEVILASKVAANLFANFMPIFLASQVQKKLSLLEGKLNERVAVSKLSIVEDPLMELGKVYRSFDDEASPTRKKYLVREGILETYLHNNDTAQKDGLVSTGNGFKASHKSSIGVEATNVYLQPGEKDLDQLIKTMVDGVVITEIHGLHAGINPVSGDFSLSSNGLLIEGGRIVRPLSQITMAGNFFEMLKEIKEIGSDTSFSHPSGTFFGSPSLYVGELDISGK